MRKIDESDAWLIILTGVLIVVYSLLLYIEPINTLIYSAYFITGIIVFASIVLFLWALPKVVVYIWNKIVDWRTK